MSMFKSFVLMSIVWVCLYLAIKNDLPWIGKLPGDLHFHGNNWEVRIPVTTCIAISAIIVVISFFLSKFRG